MTDPHPERNPMTIEQAIELMKELSAEAAPLNDDHGICAWMERYNIPAIRVAMEQAKTEIESSNTLIMRCRRAVPCGNVPLHTPESLPDRIRDLANEVGELSHLNDEADKTIARMTRELAEAKAVVGKLKKTDDGIPILPNEKYFAIWGDPDEPTISQCRYIGNAKPWVEYDWEIDGADDFVYLIGVYSTRELAEAALATRKPLP